MEMPPNVTCIRKDWEILHAIRATAAPYIAASAESSNVNLSGVNIRGSTQPKPKPRQEESDWVRVEGQKLPEDTCRKLCMGLQPVSWKAFGRPHYLSGSMKNCVGINGAHRRPFFFNINNVKHELTKSVDSYCGPRAIWTWDCRNLSAGANVGPYTWWRLPTLGADRTCSALSEKS